VLPAEGEIEKPDLGSGDPVDAFVAELTEVTRCVDGNTPSALLDGALARDALILCHKQTESAASGKAAEI